MNAYAPDEGESVIQLTGTRPGSLLAVPDPSTVFDFVQYPGAAPGDVDTYVKTSLFRKVMAAHLPAAQADVLAASQRPVALSALTAPATAAAWKTIKSYFFVGTTDNAIPAALQRDMAKRADGVVKELKADHLSMLEAPHEVTSSSRWPPPTIDRMTNGRTRRPPRPAGSFPAPPTPLYASQAATYCVHRSSKLR